MAGFVEVRTTHSLHLDNVTLARLKEFVREAESLGFLDDTLVRENNGLLTVRRNWRAEDEAR